MSETPIRRPVPVRDFAEPPRTPTPSPVSAAWRRLRFLETKYDRRIAVSSLVAIAYVAAWTVYRMTG